MYILCRDRDKFEQLLLKKFFYVCGCFRKHFKFLRNVRLLLKDINVRLLLKENVQLIFLCIHCCFWKHFMSLREYAAASAMILTTAFERKCAAAYLQLNVQLNYVHLRKI